MVRKLTDLYNVNSSNRNASKDGYIRPSIAQHFSSRKGFVAILKNFLRASNIKSPQWLLTNDEWLYLDTGDNPGSDWMTSDFDDSGWYSGYSPFSYGQSATGGTTVVGNKTAYYFRTKTYLYGDDNPEVKFNFYYDDGIIIYVNGNEVYRHNMPEPPAECDNTTLATSGGNPEILTTCIDSTYFVEGENTVAVEVHNVTTDSWDIYLELTTAGSNSVLTKGPYLMLYGSDSVKVLWQLSEAGTCSISWGTDLDNLNNYAVVDGSGDDYGYMYSHVIDNLTSSTRYYYIVNENGVLHAGDFISPVSSNSTKASFFTLGDTAAYPQKHHTLYNLMLSDINSDYFKQSFFLHLGDIIGDAGSSELSEESAWSTDIFPNRYRGAFNFMSRVPWVITRGNHDVNDDGGTSDALRKYWPHNYADNVGFYHSFDYGPIHFTIIDQYVDYDVGSAQYNWIVSDLSSTIKPWKIVAFHEPAYTNHSPTHSDSGYAKTRLQPLCEVYGVKLVLSGHNHSYSRVSVNGVQHVTAAGGGGVLYDQTGEVDSAGVLECAEHNHHYCHVSADSGILTFRATDINGNLIESFNIVKSLSNTAPTVVIDTVTVEYETVTEINVLSNDNDVDNDTLFLSGVGQPSYGTTVISNNAVLYTPNNGYSGQDSFTYTVSDGAAMANGTVNVTVGEEPTYNVEPSGNVRRVAVCTDEYWSSPTFAGKGSELVRDAYYTMQYDNLERWAYLSARDLTTSGTNESEVVEVLNHDAVTNSPIIIDDWTTSTDNFIVIKTIGDARNAVNTGAIDNNANILELSTGGPPLVINNATPIHLYIDGLQSVTSQASGTGACLSVEGAVGVVEITNSYLFSTSTAYYGGGIDVLATSGVVRVWNCVCSGGAQGITQRATGATTKVYNSIITGFASDAIESDNHNLSCYNCVVFNNGDDFKDAFMEISNCASDDADGTNAINLNGNASNEWTNAFVDYTSSDFRIKNTNSLLYNTGKDVSAEWTDLLGQTQVGKDIVGNAFVTNDVGPFAYQS